MNAAVELWYLQAFYQ